MEISSIFTIILFLGLTMRVFTKDIIEAYPTKKVHKTNDKVDFKESVYLVEDKRKFLDNNGKEQWAGRAVFSGLPKTSVQIDNCEEFYPQYPDVFYHMRVDRDVKTIQTILVKERELRRYPHLDKAIDGDTASKIRFLMFLVFLSLSAGIIFLLKK
jgi:hypothetical protein